MNRQFKDTIQPKTNDLSKFIILTAFWAFSSLYLQSY